MTRTREPRRFDDILDAALRVFTAKGYRQARMDEVARAAGVSPGLLYTYVESKEALFQLVVQRELGVDRSAVTLPARAPSAKELEAMMRRGMREVASIPSLDAALAADEPADVRAEVAAIIGEHYDRVHAYRRLVRLVERSAADWPEQSDRVYERGRRPFVRRLATYIERRVASGHLRPVPDPEVAARFAIESVAWFANHRYGDHDGAEIDDDVARATVVQLVTAALAGAPKARRSLP